MEKEQKRECPKILIKLNFNANTYKSREKLTNYAIIASFKQAEEKSCSPWSKDSEVKMDNAKQRG